MFQVHAVEHSSLESKHDDSRVINAFYSYPAEHLHSLSFEYLNLMPTSPKTIFLFILQNKIFHRSSQIHFMAEKNMYLINNNTKKK